MAEPVGRVHPRIRARRVEVRRAAGRRRLRLLVGATAILSTVAVGWGITRSPLLDVDRVTFGGAQRTDPSMLAAAAGVRVGDAMVDVDPGHVAASLEQLPWVATATARRAWPNTVEITVTERTAVAAVGFADDWVLADGSGRVLAAAPDDAGGLARVFAPAGLQRPAPGETLTGLTLDGVRLASSAVDAAGERVDTVTVDEERGAVLGLTGGIDAIIGETHDLDAKLVALTTLLARVELAGVTTIDLRVPSAPVLTRA